MNILFLNPSRLDEKKRVVKYKKAFLPPLSLAILSSLTPHKHSTYIVNDLVEEINYSDNVDLVAITSMTCQIDRAYQIARRFKEKGVKVIFGGIHATIFPEEVKKYADSVVIGEADDIWEDILNDFEENREKAFYKADRFPDLKKRIIPNWNQLNLKIYPKPFGHQLPMMPIFTTRGCVHACKFCSVSNFFGRSYRFKPISHVIDEINSIPAKKFFFVDDNIICNKDYSRELFTGIAHLKINWFSQISTNVLKYPELIELAAQSGCDSLFIGIESIDKSSLSQMNKKFNNASDYAELFKIMRKNNISPIPSLIIGFDEDTPETLNRMYDFLLQNQISIVFIWILTPLPGTELFTEMNHDKRVHNLNWSMYDFNHVVFSPKKFGVDELYNAYWKFFQKFYSYPQIANHIYFNIKNSRNKAKRFFDSIFYQLYFRKKVYSFENPISGGFFRVKP